MQSAQARRKRELNEIALWSEKPRAGASACISHQRRQAFATESGGDLKGDPMGYLRKRLLDTGFNSSELVAVEGRHRRKESWGQRRSSIAHAYTPSQPRSRVIG